MSVTFDDALAACIARWGEPTDGCDDGFAYWPEVPASTEPGCEFDGVSLGDDGDGAYIVATRHGASRVLRLAWAPAVTPLAEALDAADAFRAGHAR